MNIPADLKYTASHEWVRLEGDGTITVGITEYAQDALGDIVFVELPTVGNTYGAGDDAAVVESVKAASDIYAPIAGEVVAVNDDVVNRLSRSTPTPTPTGCSRSSQPTCRPWTACSTLPPMAPPPARNRV